MSSNTILTNLTKSLNPTVQVTDPKRVKGLNNILDALYVKGLLSPDEVNSIKFESINSGKPVEQILLSKSKITQIDLAKVNAEMRGIGFIDLDNIAISSEVLNLLSKESAKENLAIVFEKLTNKVKVAMKDPLDLQKVKLLQSVIRMPIESYYASEESILRVIDTKFGAQVSSEVDQALEQVYSTNDEVNNAKNANSGDLTDNAPIIKIVDMIMDYAVKHKASDVHIEPREDKVSVRFRIRGVLSEKLTLPSKLINSVVSRIKIMSDMKIDEKRIPQDGRFPVVSGDNKVDIRVSTIPSVYGEKVVMRLLEKEGGIMDIKLTGLTGVNLERMIDALKRTQGIILVSGPTGSGKTQTLASALKEINKPEINIITLEDPVEIRVDGVTQVQVNTEVGLTFATGLRSILRQDPDVVMVGEIRDSETASLAVQAALIGRLVLSTVHTNSASAAFIRLIDMGVEPYLLSSTINLVVGQRLVRVLCDCNETRKANQLELQQIHTELDSIVEIKYKDSLGVDKLFNKSTIDVDIHIPKGCPKCNDTGYISRTGIFETLRISEKIAMLVQKKVSDHEIGKQAILEGMVTMSQDGFIKVLGGITTLEEVLRVRNE
jgi:type IV pilus assembly protein PilB